MQHSTSHSLGKKKANSTLTAACTPQKKERIIVRGRHATALGAGDGFVYFLTTLDPRGHPPSGALSGGRAVLLTLLPVAACSPILSAVLIGPPLQLQEKKAVAVGPQQPQSWMFRFTAVETTRSYRKTTHHPEEEEQGGRWEEPPCRLELWGP
eukprot:m.40611 g.40611  ORF g.40611 m.40611 type:complete len:153 (+) comp11910_c0_seq3:357-815(+)